MQKKIKLPDKRSLNLATVGENNIKVSIAMPLIVLIIVAAAVFSKLFVVDRLLAMSRAVSEKTEMQERVDTLYEQIRSYGDLTEEYAHYTFSGMTTEELTAADRLEVMDLLERIVYPRAVVSSWVLSGNELNIPITGASLQEINEIVALLEEDPLVNYCYVSTAKTDNLTDTSGYEDVTGQVTVYLNEGSYGTESDGDQE